MARIRTIKPGFYASESLAEVSIYAERTFGGLITLVDDSGRIKDNAAIIHGAIWALRPAHTAVDVESDLIQLEKAGLICRYTVNGKRYLHLVTFAEHQKISHATESKLPECPHEIHGRYLRDRLAYGEVPESSGKTPEDSGELPLGSGSGSGSGIERSPAPAAEPLAPLAEKAPKFEDFWNSWPRKVGKAAAQKAWTKAVTRQRASPAAILAASQSYAERCRLTGQDPQFIPHAATWLNRGSWEDDLDAVIPLGPGVPRPSPVAELPPHCGHCDPANRWIELPDGSYARCPDCNPDAIRSRT